MSKQLSDVVLMTKFVGVVVSPLTVMISPGVRLVGHNSSRECCRRRAAQLDGDTKPGCIKTAYNGVPRALQREERAACTIN